MIQLAVVVDQSQVMPSVYLINQQPLINEKNRFFDVLFDVFIPVAMSSDFCDLEMAALKRLMKKGREYWYIGSCRCLNGPLVT